MDATHAPSQPRRLQRNDRERSELESAERACERGACLPLLAGSSIRYQQVVKERIAARYRRVNRDIVVVGRGCSPGCGASMGQINQAPFR